jgi:RNA polymerase sigma-70 factor, ECF subfamily
MPNGVDVELVRQVKEGNRQAFDELVQKYQFKIVKLVSRYVQDPVEAMDVTQESFIKAYKALDKFRGDSSFYTWLYRIAINTAKNYAVLQNKKPIDADVETIDIEQTLSRFQKEFTAPERILIKSELECAVLDVIERLPKELKTAIILRELEGLTYEEIAGVMACPVGTVRSRIFRARESIERRIEPILRRFEH